MQVTVVQMQDYFLVIILIYQLGPPAEWKKKLHDRNAAGSTRVMHGSVTLFIN